jgi:Tfp pilus assembly protein PilF
LLAQAYAQQNDFIRAREQLDFAIQLAPSGQRAEMQQFRQMLEPK